MSRPTVRQLLAWALAAAGAVALFLGWYGASGTAVTAKQVPYVVSGGLTGVCLLVLSAACFAADDVRRSLDRLSSVEDRIDTLYRLLTAPAEDSAADDDEVIVALVDGGAYHRRSCRLVRGKQTADVVTASVVQGRGLVPCRVCDPPGLRVA